MGPHDTHNEDNFFFNTVVSYRWNVELSQLLIWMNNTDTPFLRGQEKLLANC